MFRKGPFGRAAKAFAAIVATLVFVATVVFVVDLFHAKKGEVASALGSLIGGVVGAAGAVAAVQLMLFRQRREESDKVSGAIRVEIGTFVKYIIGAVEICIAIAQGAVTVPWKNARYMLKNLWDAPIVYPAVADRVGLLTHPQATTAFYMRLSEAKAMVDAVEAMDRLPQGHYAEDPVSGGWRTGGPPHVTPDFARRLAESLITALQLAMSIIADEHGTSTGTKLDAWVRAEILRQIEACLNSAKQTFPDAESFQAPPDS